MPLQFLLSSFFAATAVPPTRVSRRVAVIGGGSGGVVAARFLKRAGHKPVIFESGTQFGGVWADSPTNPVVYKNLHTNLPTVVMQSPDLDFEPDLPSYITKPQLGRYIERYAEAFGVAPLANFGASVKRVTCLGKGDNAGTAAGAEPQWEVQWRTAADGATHTETFDAVIVANGHYESPYVPSVPGDTEWLAGDATRSIVHSREYDDPDDFAGRSVLVVGGRSSGVDISRELRGVAKWVYILEKKCEAAVTHEGEAITHVPFGAKLSADGQLRLDAPTAADAASSNDAARSEAAASGEAAASTDPAADSPTGTGTDAKRAEIVLPGPPVDRVVLATGYVYSFPFLDEAALGMSFRGKRFVTPLYQHLMHTKLPSLGFIGVPLAVPCPIPYFECQAAYLAEAWARPASDALTTESERERWLDERIEAVGERTQDLHFTSAGGGNPWAYMRELLRLIHAEKPPTKDGESWVERTNWEARLSTVESVYKDRGARYPKKPWHDDAYRRCEYQVDWESGTWSVDDSRAQAAAPGCEQEQEAAAA